MRCLNFVWDFLLSLVWDCLRCVWDCLRVVEHICCVEIVWWIWECAMFVLRLFELCVLFWYVLSCFETVWGLLLRLVFRMFEKVSYVWVVCDVLRMFDVLLLLCWFYFWCCWYVFEHVWEYVSFLVDAMLLFFKLYICWVWFGVVLRLFELLLRCSRMFEN